MCGQVKVSEKGDNERGTVHGNNLKEIRGRVECRKRKRDVGSRRGVGCRSGRRLV